MKTKKKVQNVIDRTPRAMISLDVYVHKYVINKKFFFKIIIELLKI
jgi:hypothetical protein